MLAPSYEEKVLKFVDTTPSYTALVPFLKVVPLRARVPGLLGAEPDSGDSQAGISFRLDVTGHVMVAATKDQTGNESQAVQDLFAQCGVLLGAVTAALAKKQKTLYDYDALRQILMGSGDFVTLGISDRTFHSSDANLTLDVAVIAEVMSSFVGVDALVAAPTVMNIAKKVVGNVGAQLTASASDQSGSKKVGHLMFFCQNLMGAPMVSISCFYSSYKESMTNIKTPCASIKSNTVDFAYHQEDYMFISPAAIAKYGPQFTADRTAYDKLITTLADLIKDA
jgi:hypothetical protein